VLLLVAAVAVVAAATPIVSPPGTRFAAAATSADLEIDRIARAVDRCQRSSVAVRLDAARPDPVAIRALAATCTADLGDRQPRSIEWVRTTVGALDARLRRGGHPPRSDAAEPVIALQIVGAFTLGGGSGAYLVMVDPGGNQLTSVQGPDAAIDLSEPGDVQR
jgi:hypothetical protein